MHVAILHPDLGIGGAEMLIINLALALKSKGYQVTIFTPHFDPNRCFAECEQLDIRVVGSWFPRTIFGRFIALCAYIRMMIAALWLVFFSGLSFDFYVLDQVSFPIPILRMTSNKVLFYCHFPDKLLATNRSGGLMRFYRFFLDFAEEVTTGMANQIVVNSQFTQHIFEQSFPMIAEGKGNRGYFASFLTEHKPQILYPAIDPAAFESVKQPQNEEKSLDDLIKEQLADSIMTEKTQIFTSLNRYERKKNIPLAIKAFHKYLRDQKEKQDVLVIAGGYDPRVTENVEHHKELKQLAIDLGIDDRVVFLRSISNYHRIQLLKKSQVLMYTPQNEHFGIVPVEAMYMGCVVIACNSGGPLESIEDKVTGFLLPPDDDQWAKGLKDLQELDLDEMKVAGRKRVERLFTNQAFAEKLDFILKGMGN